MVDSTFKERVIEATIKFADTGETVTLSGLRMRANVSSAIFATMGEMQLQISGLSLEMMSRLTTIGFIRNQNGLHQIQVAAGDKGEAMSVIHEGTIDVCWAQIDQPEATLNIIAHSATLAALNPVGAISYKNDAKVKDIMADLAKEAGYTLEDKGVEKTLDNPYFSGSTWDKIKACARAAGISYAVEKNTLTIWQDEKIKGSGLTIAPDGDLILLGYPTASNSGIMVRTLFYPDAKATEIYTVRSENRVANGKWQPSNISHELDCYLPGGQWQTIMQMSRRDD